MLLHRLYGSTRDSRKNPKVTPHPYWSSVGLDGELNQIYLDRFGGIVGRVRTEIVSRGDTRRGLNSIELHVDSGIVTINNDRKFFR